MLNQKQLFMKICIVGTGGVGGYFGARLAESGYDVAFVARGEHLKAIQQEGLKVKSINGDVHLKNVRAVEVPEDKFDIILVAVKVWQMGTLGAWLPGVIHDESVVLPLENGIESAEILSSIIEPSKVLGGLCRIFSWIEAPGLIRHSAYDPSITFGELDNQKSERVETIGKIFKKSNIRFTIAEDVQREIWVKFLFITSSSAIGALTRVPYGIYRTVPESRLLLEEVLHEMVDLGIAAGIHLTKKQVESTMNFIDKMPEDATTSLQRDIMAGKPSELEGQLGAVIRLAKKLKVKVEHCNMVYSALLPQEKVARGEL